jgi:hypothetical protein
MLLIDRGAGDCCRLAAWAIVPWFARFDDPKGRPVVTLEAGNYITKLGRSSVVRFM